MRMYVGFKLIVARKRKASMKRNMFSEISFDGGVAFRWRVPGKGRRKVYGELTTWTMSKPDAVKIHDAERGTQPRYRLQPRGAGARGLVFQDTPRGWFVDGEAVTPWRVTVW